MISRRFGALREKLSFSTFHFRHSGLTGSGGIPTNIHTLQNWEWNCHNKLLESITRQDPTNCPFEERSINQGAAAVPVTRYVPQLDVHSTVNITKKGGTLLVAPTVNNLVSITTTKPEGYELAMRRVTLPSSVSNINPNVRVSVWY